MRKKINLIIFFFLIIKISIASEELNMFSNTTLNSIEYYETYENLLQNNKSIQNELENNNKIKIIRNSKEKIMSMEWSSHNNAKIIKKRNFTYDENHLLKEITYLENNEIINRTIMGKNKIGMDFFNYIFSPAFTPREYNYLTKTTFYKNLPIEHEIVSMNNHPIGKIFKKYDDKNNLVYEVWYRGKSNTILREFKITFNNQSQNYELMEIDKYGNIIRNQIALTN